MATLNPTSEPVTSDDLQVMLAARLVHEADRAFECAEVRLSNALAELDTATLELEFQHTYREAVRKMVSKEGA